MTTIINELEELRQQVESLLAANAELHGDYLAAEKEIDELRRLVEAIPEGCTPADARVLREANHALAAENDELRARVAVLNSICCRFSNIAYNLHQLGRLPNEEEMQMLKDLQAEYDSLQRANQIEGGES